MSTTRTLVPSFLNVLGNVPPFIECTALYMAQLADDLDTVFYDAFYYINTKRIALLYVFIFVNNIF